MILGCKAVAPAELQPFLLPTGSVCVGALPHKTRNGLPITFHVAIVIIFQELADSIRGDGKGDAGCDLQGVHSNDFTILMEREQLLWPNGRISIPFHTFFLLSHYFLYKCILKKKYRQKIQIVASGRKTHFKFRQK